MFNSIFCNNTTFPANKELSEDKMDMRRFIGFRISDIGFRISGFGFRVLGFGFSGHAEAKY